MDPSMNLMELLLLVDARLRTLAVADENTIQAAIGEVAVGPRPVGVGLDVDPRAVLAGMLAGIEQECRMLRDQLHVQVTFVARSEITSISSSGPVNSGQAPAPPDDSN